MPLIVTTNCTLICDVCTAAAVHVAGTSSPDFTGWADAHDWLLVSQRLDGVPESTFCPRCRPVVETIRTELDHTLPTH